MTNLKKALTQVNHMNRQLDVKQFAASTSNNMIDFMVFKMITSGCTDLSAICAKLRCQKEKLAESVTKELFTINGDTICLA